MPCVGRTSFDWPMIDFDNLARRWWECNSKNFSTGSGYLRGQHWICERVSYGIAPTNSQHTFVRVRVGFIGMIRHFQMCSE